MRVTRGEARVVERLHQGHRRLARPGGGRELLGEPVGALLGLGGAEAEPARPLAEPGRGEQVHALIRGERLERRAELLPHEQLADGGERPDALLLAAAEQRVEHLEQQILEEVGVFLVNAGRDDELPRAAGAVLDRVEQVRLARALIAEDGDDFGVRERVVAVEVDDGEE